MSENKPSGAFVEIEEGQKPPEGFVKFPLQVGQAVVVETFHAQRLTRAGRIMSTRKVPVGAFRVVEIQHTTPGRIVLEIIPAREYT